MTGKKYEKKLFVEGLIKIDINFFKKLLPEGELKKTDKKPKNKRYSQTEWRKLSKRIFERDNHTCFICKYHGEKLNAHHKIEWDTNPELAFAEDNLITLCTKCHGKLHTLERFYARNHAKKTFERLSSELKRKMVITR